MPLLAGAELLAMFEMFLLFLVSYFIFKWLVEHFVGRIPFIGGQLAGKAIAVADAMERRIASWLAPSIHTVVKWFSVMATRITNFPHDVMAFAHSVELALTHLVTVKIAEIVRVETAVMRSSLSIARAHIATLTTAVTNLPAYIEHRIGQESAALTHTLTGVFERGIDRLYRDVVEPEIVGIEHGVKTLDHALDVAVAEGRAAVGAARAEIEALARRLDIPVSVIESLIAAVGATAAIAALEALGACHPKLRMMCTTDPMALADLFAALVMLAAWPGLYELTQEAQTILGAEASLIESLAVNGASF